jgi:hypothetical protein
LEEEGPWESLEVDERLLFGRIPECTVASRSREVWVRRPGRPWPEKELNCSSSNSSSSGSSSSSSVMAHTNQIFSSSIRLHVFRGIVLMLARDHRVTWSNADSFKRK